MDASAFNEENLIKVHIDCRETKLITALGILLPSVIVTSNLELGDILIVSTGEFPFTLLFERKAGNDLEASIKDGRYAEQKKRIKSLYEPGKCTYIIENDKVNENDKILSAVIHTMYRDNMHVQFTNDVNDTANFIKNVWVRCKAHPEYFVSDKPESGYLSSLKIKSKKSDNIDVATCYILQLCQIPGISRVIATSLAAVYPTIGLLIDTLRNCPTQELKIKLLSKIDKIAVKKATDIIKFFQVS